MGCPAQWDRRQRHAGRGCTALSSRQGQEWLVAMQQQWRRYAGRRQRPHMYYTPSRRRYLKSSFLMNSTTMSLSG